MPDRQRPRSTGVAASRREIDDDARAFLSAVVQSSDDAIITKDLHGTITSWNRAAERIFGHLEREVIGKHISVIIPNERLGEEADILARLRAGHRIEHFETVRRAKDGRHLEVSITVSPIVDSSGRVIGASKIARDISGRRIEERRRKFLSDATTAFALSLDFTSICQSIVRTTIPTLADFACLDLLTPDNRIERTAWAHRSLPASEFDAIGRFTPPRISVSHPVSRALSSGRAEFVPNVDKNWILGMAVSSAHAKFLQKLRLKSLITVTLVARSKLLGALTLYISEDGRRHTRDDVDLAEEYARRASEALENALLYRDAQQAISERERFISIASHELRTPLTTLQLQLQGALRMLKKGGAGAMKKAGVSVSKAERQSTRIGRLINELLDVTRINAGKLQLQPEYFDLADLVRTVIEHFALELTQKRIPVVVKAAKPVGGRWDRFRLDQVITNLLSNAIKYGGGKPVEVSVSGEFDLATLTVRDRGPGIESSALKKIFEPYEQGESADRSGGLGLGLFISRKIVETHGGTIDVESHPGSGSIFTVKLPRKVATQS
jgi:PAS domain S-box-containing protein